VHYEIGAQGSLFSNRLSAQASLFDLENTDKLVSQTLSAVTSTINAGKQRNRGLEASLGLLVVDRPEQLLSRVRPWASYTYTDATYRLQERREQFCQHGGLLRKRSGGSLGARIGYRRTLNRHWTLDAFAGADNLTNETFYSLLFLGPNITRLATPPEGGRGDGYIIPAPYKATTYTSRTLGHSF